MWNVHMHRNPEIRETLTTFFSSGTKLLLLSWLLGFRLEERETQFLLCWLFHLTQQRAAHPVAHNWTGLAQLKDPLASSRFKSQLTPFFLKITQNHQSIASGHDIIHIPITFPILVFLLWHLWLSHPPCASVNTCTQCVH